MQLSPIASYHLRKLLRRHCDRLQPLTSSDISPENDVSDVSLEDAWKMIGQGSSETNSVAQKLESLVSLHQALEKQGSIYSQDLASVENTIFNMLGFQISSEAPCNI